MSNPNGLYAARPEITISGGVFMHNGSRMRVVFRRSGLISVGCTDVTIEALRAVIDKYDAWQRSDECVLQA